MLSRRTLLAVTAAVAGAAARRTKAEPHPAAELTSLTGDVKPIGADERNLRIGRLQTLMSRQKIGALIVESGSTLEYFTGVVWHRSERTTAAIIPANGRVLIVTPAFEEPSVRESLNVDADVRVWSEHESPFERIVQGLRDRGITSGAIAIEPTVRFFVVDGIRGASSGYAIVPGDALVRACRLIKSPAELALMQTANDITLEALRFTHARVTRGMRPADIAGLMDAATAALGGTPEFSMVLLNEASAYPHGSKQPQVVRDGSTILMDCGCTVHSYQSDISRTWVFGAASARQRKVWNTVKRGQEIALETAKVGVQAGKVDDAVRAYYESEGWGPGYKLPGLPHRTGHGIGLDGHESAYLVTAMPPRCKRGCVFPTSRASTFPASSAFVWRIAGT